jgi:tetratricopeptide (TPR) repeat protein
LEVRAGRGSLDDIRAKLSGGIPVLVQMPPGELAGLREGERFSAGPPRVAVGYDDGAKCILLLDAGAKAPLRVPYALFDHLWSRLDRWWLTLTPAKAPPRGLPGDLTLMELASGYALGRDFKRALEPLEKPDAGQADPTRWHLAKGMMLWRLGRREEARGELSGLREAPVEVSVQAELTLGAIEEQSAPPGEKSAKALEHYRRAWSSDPANETATLAFAAALAGRGTEAEAAEARQMLENYVRIDPLSLPALMLLYRL